MRVRELGSFIREQRKSASLSLRKLAQLAGVSNPYLSQIERGLRRPSAEILQAIAKALQISSESLYVQAGILDERVGTDVRAAILNDTAITRKQKDVLLSIYESFREETSTDEADRPQKRNEARPPARATGGARAPRKAARKPAPKRAAGSVG